MSLFSEGPRMREVPNLIGLDFEAARAVEVRAQVHIADPNPDAPPISNHWWEHQELVVQHQDPPAGAWVARFESVRVTLCPPEQRDPARRSPQLPLPALTAEAKSEPDGLAP